MSYFKKFNQSNTDAFNYNRDTPREFQSLENLYRTYGEDHEYTLYGFWFNRGLYGEQAVLVTDADKLVDAPIRMTDTFKEIVGDDDAVAAINKEECKYKVRKYHNKKYKKDCYTIDFV